MKKFIAAGAIGLMALGAASSASAWRFVSPVDAPFTISGGVTVSTTAVSLPCTASMSATTVGRGATITGATFSGGACGALSAAGLPWHVTVGGPHSIKIHGMSVSAVVLGICGPGDVRAQLNVHGKIVMSGANLPGSILPCSVSGTLSTHPNLLIGGHQ